MVLVQILVVVVQSMFLLLHFLLLCVLDFLYKSFCVFSLYRRIFQMNVFISPYYYMELNDININDQKNKQDKINFVVSTSTGLITVLTASILIINFSRNYKTKRPVQSTVFLFGGFLLLIVGMGLNNEFMSFLSNKHNVYGKLVYAPKMVQFIYICFLIYILYVAYLKTF